MVLPDVNVLVYAHREDAPDHDDYRDWLEGVVEGPNAYGVADLVLAGFVRVVTSPRVFLCAARPRPTSPYTRVVGIPWGPGAQEMTMKTLVVSRLAVVAAAVLLTVAPAAAQQAPAAHDTEEAAPPRGAHVAVTNHNWLDARLYVDDDGLLLPLGFVMSQQTAEFQLPTRILSSSGAVRIVARPIGSRQSYTSQNLILNHGDLLQVTLQNQLGLSSTSLLPSIQ